MSLYSLIGLLLLALCAEARIYAWGVNDYGQLGVPKTYNRYPRFIPAYEGINIIKLWASGTLHMAKADDGTVYVAGNNWYGGLGEPIDYDTPYIIQPTPNDQLFGCEIYIGKRHGNAVCPDGNFYGWGVQSGYVAGLTSGNYGKIRQSLPYYKLGSNVVNVMAGNAFSFVTVANGTTFVAGAGAHGALGNGDYKDKPYFVPFTGFHGINAKNISQSHADHVCIISDDYKLYCWGDNSYGQLGTGNTDDKAVPTLVEFFVGRFYPVQVTVGETHTVCLTASGRVFTWGKADSGALGDGRSDNSSQTTPIELTVLADKNIVSIVAGKNFNFARSGTNVWYVWGAGSGGVFGTNADFDILKPTVCPFMKNFSINEVMIGATSRSCYGYLNPAAPTNITTGPTLENVCESANPPTCPTNAHCQDTEVSYECVCNDGYQNTSTGCTDINECATFGVCVPAAVTCTNTPGNFTCTCPPTAPIGDGKTAGTGCKAAVIVTSTTTATGSTNGQTTKISGIAAATGNNGVTGNSVTTGGNSGTSGNGATSNNGGTSGQNNGGTSGNGNGGTTGGGNGGNGNSATTSTVSSTSGPVTMYQTLGGVDFELAQPEPESSSSDFLLSDEAASDDDKYKKVFIGTLVGFAVLGVAAGVAYMAVK